MIYIYDINVFTIYLIYMIYTYMKYVFFINRYMINVIYVRYMICNGIYIYIHIYEIRDKYSTYDTCEMLYTADSHICIYLSYT